MQRTRRKIAELIIEPHPSDFDGPEWITLVEYVNKTQLIVVDTLDKNYLWGYSIDAMNIIERKVFSDFMDNYWRTTLYDEPIHLRVPVHEWLYDRGLGELFGRKLIGYNRNDILRLVGHVRRADETGDRMQVKRRKRLLVTR